MKTRITILAENNVPISKLGSNPEQKVREAWEIVLRYMLLTTDSANDEKAVLEKVEVFE